MTTDPLIRNNVTVTGNLAAAKSMVFVNGLGYDQGYWNAVAQAFADDYRLILFDNAGSVPSNQAYFNQKQVRYLNVSGYAADLLEICAALRLSGDTVMVGHSLGAMAGLLASVERPATFGKLVVLGASPRYADTEGYVGGFSKGDIDAAYSALRSDYRAWSRNMAALSMATPDRPDLTDAFAASLASVPQEMMLTVLCSVLQTDHREKLAKVSVPTLIVQSKEDYFVPLSVAEFIHARIPGSTLKVIDTVGHLPHVTAPAQVVAAIRGFVG